MSLWLQLQNKLREAANPEDPRPFHVLHFIGHGEFDAQDRRTILLFEGRIPRSGRRT